MLLLIPKGPLRKAIRSALAERGEDYQLGAASDDGLFERALGQDTLVYAPARSLLAGRLDPSPDPGRMRRVIGAAAAPGCSTVVVVVPEGTGYDPELDVLRKAGKPYVIVSAPPLFEEVGVVLARSGGGVWVPRGGSIRVASASAVAHAVLAASSSEWQGRVEAVEGDVLELHEAFSRAAKSSRRKVSVHAVWPPLHRVVDPVVRWLNGSEPPASALAGALLRSSSSLAPGAS